MNMEKITDGLMKVSSVIQENKYIGAISDGLLMTMPLMIVGAIGSIVNSLGIPAWQEFLTSSGLKHITALPNEIGTNMFALFAVFAIGYRFAKGENKDGMTAGILSLMSFMMVTPLEFNEAGAMAAIPAEWLGAAGLFVAMLMGLVAAKVYCTFIEKNIVIKMPPGVPPVIERSFASILPALSVALISLVLAFLFALTSFGSLHGFVYQIIAKPLSGLSGTFPALLIAILFIHVMWSIGIHGTMIALTVFYPIWAALDMQNLAAYNAGEPAPYIVSMQFFFLCALNEKIKWPEKNGNNEYSVKGQDGKVGLEILEKRRRILFPDEEVDAEYRKIREKLIGVTLHYQPDVKSIIRTLIEDSSMGIQIKEILLDNSDSFFAVMDVNNHHNLRTFQFFLSKICYLYTKFSVMQFEAEYEKELLYFLVEDCFRWSVQFKGNIPVPTERWERASYEAGKKSKAIKLYVETGEFKEEEF